MTDRLSEKQIDALITAYLAGSLSDADRPTFEAWLRISPENPRRVARLSATDFALREVCQDTKADYLLDILNQIDDAAGPAQLVTLHQLKSSQHNYTLYAIGGAVAAVLVLAVTLVLVFSGTGNTPEIANETSNPSEPGRVGPVPSTVATLTAERDAVWAPQPGGDVRPGALRQGTQLIAGQRLVLTQGFAEITTARGAIAILEAPATIEFTDNDNALYLNAGKLVGICETPTSKGFVVKTDHADITDLGTEFGVEVNGREVTATVFSGEVEVAPEDGQTLPLAANQTVRIDRRAREPRLTLEDQVAQGFARWLPRPALVTSAQINNDRYEVRVVPGGVAEDALIHTDNSNQINGVDARGIPRFLLGGDLILTPAQAALDLERSLEVQAEFAQLSDVYLIWRSEDTSPPQWMKDEYERTPIQLGLDIGPELGVGPGESVDWTVSLWKRKQPAIGNVLIGREMLTHAYAFIAVPAESLETDP